MIEDMFEELAKSTRNVGSELQEIIKERRSLYEKYPEELVLINVYKELIQRYVEGYSGDDFINYSKGGCSLSLDEFERVTQIIYDDNTCFCMQDKFVNKNPSIPFILRPKTTEKEGYYGIYWEGFNYTQGQETTWRVALNVLPEEELLEYVDILAQKYHCSWKYVNQVDEYNKRTDPIIIYFPQKSEKDKNNILEDISQFIRPYVRKDQYDIFGYENKKNGIYYGQLPSAIRLKNDLLCCLDDSVRKNIADNITMEELRKIVQETVSPGSIQYFLADRILSKDEFSGGKLAIHEWLIKTYRETQKRTCIHCQDGSTIHKYHEVVFKRDSANKMLWRRFYSGDFKRYSERVFNIQGSCINRNLFTLNQR